jgi:hypothetical protein
MPALVDFSPETKILAPSTPCLPLLGRAGRVDHEKHERRQDWTRMSVRFAFDRHFHARIATHRSVTVNGK